MSYFRISQDNDLVLPLWCSVHGSLPPSNIENKPVYARPPYQPEKKNPHHIDNGTDYELFGHETGRHNTDAALMKQGFDFFKLFGNNPVRQVQPETGSLQNARRAFPKLSKVGVLQFISKIIDEACWVYSGCGFEY